MGGITKLSFLELIRIKYLNSHKCLDTGLFCPKFSNKSGSSAPYIIRVGSKKLWPSSLGRLTGREYRNIFRGPGFLTLV